MPDRPLFTGAAALSGANVIGKSICDSGAGPPATVAKLRLFDGSFVPDSGTTKADLVAAETALVGYPVGGYDVTDFSAAVFAPGGGAIITSTLVTIAYASGAAQEIGGYWLEDSNGDVRDVFIYDPVRSLAQVGDGWPVVVQLGYGANQ